MLTEPQFIFVICTCKPLHHSRQGRLLVWSALPVIALTLGLPYLPFGALRGLVPLPGAVPAAVLGSTLLYIAAAEFTNRVLTAVPPGLSPALSGSDAVA